MGIKMKGDDLPVCWAVFSRRVVPELSTWEIKQVRRFVKDAPADAPAHFDKALRIILTKAQPGMWGTITTDMECAEFQQSNNQIGWSDAHKACLALSPSNPYCTQ